MKHKVDLSKFNYSTDLAVESIKYNRVKDIKQKVKNIDDIKVIEVDIDKNNSKLINKKVGKYITIEFDDVTDSTNQNKLIRVLTKELKKIIHVKKNELILIVGLGNYDSTPDSLGSKCIDNIIITNHIYELDMLDKKYKRVGAIKPSVYAKTGIETSNIISSIAKTIKPNLVIVIDSLASGSINRLNKTIQITDTGINPGSGIGNKRKEISKSTLHVPVIAIGVPTVVSMSNVIYEVLNNMSNDYDINNILNEEVYNLVVTPTEIDYIIECISKVLSDSLNNIIEDDLF